MMKMVTMIMMACGQVMMATVVLTTTAARLRLMMILTVMTTWISIFFAECEFGAAVL